MYILTKLDIASSTNEIIYCTNEVKSAIKKLYDIIEDYRPDKKTDFTAYLENKNRLLIVKNQVGYLYNNCKKVFIYELLSHPGSYQASNPTKPKPRPKQIK